LKKNNTKTSSFSNTIVQYHKIFSIQLGKALRESELTSILRKN